MNRLAIVSAASAAVLLAACSPHGGTDPGVLDPVLGGVGSPADENLPDGHRVLAVDLERFERAGLTGAGAVLPERIVRLFAPDTWAWPNRAVASQGKLFVVHEGPVVEAVGRFLDALLAAADRPIDLDVEVFEETGAAPRSLARLSFQLASGRWSRQTTRAEGSYVAGIDAFEDSAALRIAPLTDGVVADAAVWRAGDAGVLHLLLTLRADAEDARTVDVAAGGAAPAWTLELPRRQTVELRGQAALVRGRWVEVARAPSPAAGRELVVRARAAWAARPAVDPGQNLAALEVALPEGRDPGSVETFVFAPTGGDLDLEAGWQKVAFDVQARESLRVANLGRSYGPPLDDVLFGNPESRRAAGTDNTAGIFFDAEGDGSGNVRNRVEHLFATSFGRTLDDESRRAMSADQPPLFPGELQSRWQAFLGADWRDAFLAVDWDRIVVRQTPAVIDRLAELLDRLHAWRNEPLPVTVETIAVDPALADRLADGPVAGDLVELLRRGRTGLPYRLVARSGAWTRLATSRTEALLNGHLVPGRTSPGLVTVSSGSSISVRPRRYGDGRLELEVRWFGSQVEAGSIDPRPVAGGLAQQPARAESRIEGLLNVGGDSSFVLLGSAVDGGPVPALLIGLPAGR